MVTARVRYPNNSVSPQIVAEGWRARGGELPCCGWLSACGAGISNVDFVAVCGRAPHGMICLNSALAYWDLSDEIPAQVHLAVPSGSHRPVIDYLRNCPACAPMAQGSERFRSPPTLPEAAVHHLAPRSPDGRFGSQSPFGGRRSRSCRRTALTPAARPWASAGSLAVTAPSGGGSCRTRAWGGCRTGCPVCH